MALKRNLLLYIKEKSTIVALIFMMVFFLFTSLTYIEPLSYKKGISENFKNYEIDFMTSNNYNVVFAVIDEYLFYSKDKEETSTLNSFAGIYDLSNEYGSATSNEYNFIRIDYRFSDDIIDVKAIRDNGLGANGEVWVLTKNNYLYLISNRSKTVDLIHRNIKSFSLYKDYNSNEVTYLFLDTNNNLYKGYFDNNEIYKELLLTQSMDDFYYIGKKDNQETLMYNYNNELYHVTYNNTLTDKTFEKEQTTAYSIKTCDVSSCVITKKTNILSSKIVALDDKFYSLYDGKVSNITCDVNLQTIPLNINQYVNDIYTTGVDALVAICDTQLYFVGDLKFDESQDYINFKELNIDNGLIYSGKNATFLLDKKGYVYKLNNQTNNYEIFYQRTLLKYAIRYLSIFLISMTILYLIIAFFESNKRYNRYFKVNNHK